MNARPRTLADVHAQLRDLRRQIDFLRSARAVTARSLLNELAEGADSLAGAALTAAVNAQSAATEAQQRAELALSRVEELDGSGLVPLTTVVNGEPTLVWDANNNLIMTEA